MLRRVSGGGGGARARALAQVPREPHGWLARRSMHPAVERKLALETTVLEEKYTLPDGRVIRLGKERFEAPEALFRPSLIDCDQPGVGDMLFDMIQAWALAAAARDPGDVCVCVWGGGMLLGVIQARDFRCCVRGGRVCASACVCAGADLLRSRGGMGAGRCCLV